MELKIIPFKEYEKYFQWKEDYDVITDIRQITAKVILISTSSRRHGDTGPGIS